MKPSDTGAGLSSILVELTSAMSALNMPTPEECPPEMVRHAYEHLESAMKMLGEMPSHESASSTFSKSAQEFIVPRPPKYDDWRVARLREDEMQKEIDRVRIGLDNRFLGCVSTPETKHAIADVVMQTWAHWEQTGLVVKPGTPNCVPVSWYW